MKYEIGQQVETPFGKGKIFDTSNSGDMYHVTLKDDSTKWFWENYLKPYRTPHEKLIEMGFEFDDRFSSIPHYTNSVITITIYKHLKTYLVYKRLNDDLVQINLELSRILTEYLEWLEEEKWNL